MCALFLFVKYTFYIREVFVIDSLEAIHKLDLFHNPFVFPLEKWDEEYIPQVGFKNL